MNQKNNIFLENNLINHLKPVRPNPDFTENLRKRLFEKKEIRIENPKFGYAYLLASLGLFLGVFLAWLVRRN